jgi:hypothetical protein
MTSKLTSEQCQQVRELAAIGVLLFDALVSLGFSPTEADEMSQDNAIIDEHRRGRSDGATKVRKALIKAGEKGSVSALKALNMHRSDDDIDAELYPKRKAHGSAVKVDVVGSVDALFERLRELHERVPLESKLVNIKARKVSSDNG